MSQANDRLLGQLAVELNLINGDQLTECLRERKFLSSSGEDTSLPQLLLRHGYINDEGLDRLMKEELLRWDDRPNLSRYEVLEKLGEGSAAVIFKARDRDLNRTVALKVLRHAASEKPATRKRFEREAKAAASLSHPNLVGVYDLETSGSHMVLVIEYVEGKALNELLALHTLSIRDTVALLEKVARGLAEAHKNNIVHRDVKPGNIMVTSHGEPKVADFGLAFLVGSETGLTKTGTTLGTPLYMAPEQVDGIGKSITPATDVYALGTILYEALTGDPPHLGNSAMEVYGKIVEADPIAPRSRNSAVPRELEIICMKALEKHPRRRYATAHELADELRRYLDGDPILSHPSSRFYRLTRKITKRRSVLVSGIIGLLLAGGILAATVPLLRGRSRELEQELAEKQASNLVKKQELEVIRNREDAQKRARIYIKKGEEKLAQLELLCGNPVPPLDDIRQIAGRVREELAGALKEVKDHPEALVLIAKSYHLEENYPEAERMYQEAIEKQPGNISAYMEHVYLALQLYEGQRHDENGNLLSETEAAALIRKKVERDVEAIRKWSEKRAELDFAEGVLYLAGGKYKEGATKLEVFGQDEIADWRGWYWAGHAWMHVKDWKGCVRALNRAVELRPGYIPARFQLSLAYMNLEQWQEARPHLEHIVRVQPRYVMARIAMARVLLLLGDLEGCQEECEQVLEMAPNHAQAFYFRALALQRLGKLKQAVDDLNRSIAARDDYAEAYLVRGKILRQLKQYDPAMEDFGSAVKLDPKNDRAFNARGMLHQTLENWKEAKADYDQAIHLNDRNWSAIYHRGNWYREHRRDWDAARKEYDRAIELNPQFGKSYANRGVCYQMMRKNRSALADYKLARTFFKKGSRDFKVVQNLIEGLKRSGNDF